MNSNYQSSFRGKTLAGDWAYGDLLNVRALDGKQGCIIVTDNRIKEVVDNKVDTDFPGLSFDRNEFAVVSQDTVCSWSGLYDREGDGIFSKDIVFVERMLGKVKQEFVAEVFYEHGCYVLHIDPDDSTFDIMLYAMTESENCKVTIIGNSLDNPDLLP